MEVEVEGAKLNGVLQPKLDCLDTELNSTACEVNDSAAVEIVSTMATTMTVEGSPHPDSESELHDVDLNHPQARDLGGGGEGIVQGHSPNPPGEREGVAGKEITDPENCGNSADVSIRSEPQCNLDHSKLNTGELDDSQSHDTSTSEGTEVVKTSSGIGMGEERREIPNTDISDRTNPSIEEIPIADPIADSANLPVARASSPEVLESVPVMPTTTAATSEDSNTSQEIPAATRGVRGTTDHERTESQTSFVNEYALSGSQSPTYEVDRNLEQFSEILLESDVSDGEVQAEEGSGDAIEVRKKATKRVRFADEVAGLEGSQHGHSSPPPPPSSLPTHPSPEPTSKHPGVPITPSPTSPKQKAPCQRFTVDELINGVELPAEYLGSTPIILDGLGAMKTARMFQAQQAVQLIKDPESMSRPHFAVKLKISTGSIKIADSNTDVDLMEHPLHTITYVADIDHVLVIMAHVRPPPLPNSPSHTTGTGPRSTTNGAGEATEGEEAKYIPKMTCHVLDSSNAREAAMVIGQAFSAAYKQFLRSSGISDQHLEQAEYMHILNAQSVPRLEVESLGDRNKIKKLTLAKHKNDIMGMMVIESGYGSALPACVIVHLSKTGSASKCGLLNIGDHILSINGVNLVGMPRKACLEQIKKCRYMNVVKMEVCSCPTVVEVSIVRPDLKYQLGFSVHEGTICSLVRGSIAERSGVRVGHRIIDINGTSTVGMQHSDVVHLLSSTVGDLHIRMMSDVLYKLLTGKLQPEYY